MDYELTLYDRIEIIKTAQAKYDLEKNAYLSFSGGKDSTVMHYLLDMALPNNNIPRVFIDTGIEYQAITKFVKHLAETDKRFIRIKPTQNIKELTTKYGYPFKSKQHSHDLAVYQHSGMTTTVKKYLRIEAGKNLIACPKSLMYQFSPEFKIKISDQCCNKMKKEPAHRYEKESGRTITITGMRKAEGGQRIGIKGCIVTNQETGRVKFHPLLVVDDAWEQEFITNIERERE